MVSPMGDNVGDDKGWDEKVISTGMDTGSDSSDNGYGKDVSVCGGMEGDV